MSASEPPPISRHEATRILQRATAAGGEGLGDLLPHLYQELRALAAHLFRDQPRNHTLQPTALVHEAYLRLIDHDEAGWNGRAHFIAVASKAMRQILVDHYRRRNAQKRGGDWKRQTLSGSELGLSGQELDLLAVSEALDELTDLDERQGRVVEMKFFGGLQMEEIAEVLGVSKTTVEGEWRHARAWLGQRLG